MKILVKYHANGDISDPLPHAEHREILDTLTYEKEFKSGWSALYKTREDKNQFNLLALKFSGGARWRMGIVIAISILAQMTGSNIVGYVESSSYFFSLNINRDPGRILEYSLQTLESQILIRK